jgi:hypothetical protein
MSRDDRKTIVSTKRPRSVEKKTKEENTHGSSVISVRKRPRVDDSPIVTGMSNSETHKRRQSKADLGDVMGQMRTHTNMYSPGATDVIFTSHAIDWVGFPTKYVFWRSRSV